MSESRIMMWPAGPAHTAVDKEHKQNTLDLLRPPSTLHSQLTPHWHPTTWGAYQQNPQNLSLRLGGEPWSAEPWLVCSDTRTRPWSWSWPMRSDTRWDWSVCLYVCLSVCLCLSDCLSACLSVKWQTFCSPFLFHLEGRRTDCPTHISLKEGQRMFNLMYAYSLNNNPVDFPGK